MINNNFKFIKLRWMILVIILIMSSPQVTHAVPILNLDEFGDPIDTLANGDPYGVYTNSGQLLFIESGNISGKTENLENAESKIEESLGFDVTFELIPTDVNYDDVDGNTGIWYAEPVTNAISFYAVKAANAYAMYWVKPPEGTGSWSTFDLSEAGYGGNDGVEISHYTGYNLTSVPDAGIMWLLGPAFIALGVFRSRKLRT